MQRHKKQNLTHKPDRKFLVLTLFLTVIGLVALADVSAPLAARDFSDRFFFAKQQALWAGIGVLFFFLSVKIKYTFWEKIATPLFFVSILGLILVFIPGLGVRLLGAKRWIVIGTATFQPSEFVKLALSVYLAKLAVKNKRPASFFVPIAIVTMLIMLQPDLGTAIVIAGMALVQVFAAGMPLIYFLASMILGAVAGLILIITSDYRRERLLTFLQQTKDPLDESYHIRQILLALGSGGLFGVGLGHSRQKYLFIPETATDSIFAVIAEEIGFLGTGLLILVFFLFIYKGLTIAKYAPDKFSQVLSVGLIAWIGGQMFLNIASMLALVPLTGIPLPFFSYGGSSEIAILTACGILLNISKYAKAKE